MVKVNQKKINAAIYTSTAFKLSEKYGLERINDHQIKAVAARALEEINKSPNRKKIHAKFLKSHNDKFVEKVISEILVSAKSPWEPQLEGLTNRQKMIFTILRGSVLSFNELKKDTSLFPAVVLKKNPVILNEAKGLVQKIFDNMAEEIHNNQFSESDSFHLEMIIGDLLSLYPFLSPKENERLRVPILMNGQWELVEYSINKLKLTPRWMGSPIVAYGLHAKDAPPLLLFKGTTYPTDKGFGLSLLTDINPGASVGEYVFNHGKEKIHKWLEKNAKDSKAIIYGKSLGGALAWKTALHFPNRVEKAMAYGAPGFSKRDLKKQKKLCENNSHPKITLFCQKNDPVPYFDRVAKQGVNYYQVVGTKLRRGILAHADMFSTHENSIILQLDPVIESKRWQRLALTILRDTLSIPAFPLLILIHSIYLLCQRSIQAGLSFKKNSIERWINS